MFRYSLSPKISRAPPQGFKTYLAEFDKYKKFEGLVNELSSPEIDRLIQEGEIRAEPPQWDESYTTFFNDHAPLNVHMPSTAVGSYPYVKDERTQVLRGSKDYVYERITECSLEGIIDPEQYRKNFKYDVVSKKMTGSALQWGYDLLMTNLDDDETTVPSDFPYFNPKWNLKWDELETWFGEGYGSFGKEQLVKAAKFDSNLKKIAPISSLGFELQGAMAQDRDRDMGLNRLEFFNNKQTRANHNTRTLKDSTGRAGANIKSKKSLASQFDQLLSYNNAERSARAVFKGAGIQVQNKVKSPDAALVQRAQMFSKEKIGLTNNMVRGFERDTMSKSVVHHPEHQVSEQRPESESMMMLEPVSYGSHTKLNTDPSFVPLNLTRRRTDLR